MSQSAVTVPPLPAADREILRRLAERKLACAASPVNRERRQAWYAHDAGVDDRVMVLAEHGGVRDARRPLDDSVLTCSDPWARGVERGLRHEFYQFDVLQDDHVIEPWCNVGWRVSKSDYGVTVPMRHGDNDGHLGARTWDHPIKDLDRDFDKLKHRSFAVDRAATLAEQARLEAVFEGLLPVRIRGGHFWTFGLTWPAIELVGLENFMLYMYDNPAGVHRLMAFLRDDHRQLSDWLQAEGLYTLNNENDYIGSGALGYTRALPQADWRPGQPVRSRDLWCLLESQETVGVGPELFEEFIFPYQLSLAKEFGRLYYGCCEPVNNRLHVLLRLPNLHRISVSPWADQAYMAEKCGRAIAFSRKPNPTLISTEHFDEAAIRADLRQTLQIARGCRLELIMKDVHTLNNQPERLARWVQLARDEIAKLG